MSVLPRWAVAYDFDGTLVPKLIGALMPLVAERGLAEAAMAEMRVIHATYVHLFGSGSITAAQYREWLVKEFDLYIRYQLNVADWHAALRHVRLRPGVIELMTAVHEAGMVQCVVSGAVADFVEYVLEINGARHLVEAVYATRLRHEPRGAVIGYDEDSMVHLENKGEWSMYFAGRHGVLPQHLIAVGDSIGDARLGYLRQHRFGIAETEADAEFLRGLGVMGDVAVVDDRLEPVASAIRLRIGLPPF